ncbi:hypothetical protein TNCV_4964541 [Trichonephila clavipes]|nr:hypothetical protein TNCV_4964541 [Trichonephila clavipes]
MNTKSHPTTVRMQATNYQESEVADVKENPPTQRSIALKLGTCFPSQRALSVLGEFMGVVGGQQLVFVKRPKRAIGFMSGEHAGHSIRTIPSSKRKSSARLARCGLQLSSIKMK